MTRCSPVGEARAARATERQSMWSTSESGFDWLSFNILVMWKIQKSITYGPVAAAVVLPDGHPHRHLLTRLPVFFTCLCKDRLNNMEELEMCKTKT